MKPNKFKNIGLWQVAVFIALLGFVSVGAAADSPLNVYVVNYPLKYFAERIGGDHVKVTFPVPPDVDPAYWIPSIAEISGFQRADVILLNGAGYAKWLSKVSLPRSKIVDTSRQFQDRLITVKEATTHSHGAAGEHAHEDLAFTTWLDLSLAAKQAEAIFEALTRIRPQQKDLFRANYQALENDLLVLDRQMKAVISESNSVPIIFSHPVYDYLAKGYALNGRSVHWEPDQEPTPGQISELKKLLETHSAHWMIWEGTAIASTVGKLKTIGIKSVVFNPCGNRPIKGDFLSVMQQNVKNIEPIFR